MNNEFIRDEKYKQRLFVEALDNEVVLDANIVIIRVGRKLKAYAPQVNMYVQFPTAIRQFGKCFIADLIKAKRKDGKPFMSAVKQSIREVS